jgi:hypothetical protein
MYCMSAYLFGHTGSRNLRIARRSQFLAWCLLFVNHYEYMNEWMVDVCLHHRLVYADDVNLFSGSINTIKWNTEHLLDAIQGWQNGNKRKQDKVLYVYSYLVTRMPRCSTVWRRVINVLKTWRSSNIWELEEKIKMTFITKLRTD